MAEITSQLDAIEARLLLEAIYDRSGYDFRGYSQPTILRRLKAALTKSGLGHLGDLQHRLLVDANFLQVVLEDLTIQVSEMFRDPDFFRALRLRVLPLLRTYPRLKVWHAGCASGEEVYSTAIALLEEGLLDRTQIYATDISASAIERAKEGVYAEKHFDTFASNYKAAGGTAGFEDYCARRYGRLALHEGLRRNIVFFQHNLAADYAIGEVQIVFCRNVLIYFGPELRRRVTALFGECLSRGGFLCLGRSEHVPDRQPLFSLFDLEEQIYRKASHA